MDLLFPLAYLLAAVLFIQGIRRLSKVRTAKSGNTLSATAMLIAIVVTMAIISGQAAWPFIIAGILIGAGIGLVAAQRVEMTQMPEMVALFNGFGGGASALVSLSLFFSMYLAHEGGTYRFFTEGAPISSASRAASTRPRARATMIAVTASVASCAVKAFVEATPISGPAPVGRTIPTSRAIELSVTFTTPIVAETRGAAWRNAASVSAVSPDCETKIATSLPSSGASR